MSSDPLPWDLPSFDLQFAVDKSLPVVIDINNNNNSSKNNNLPLYQNFLEPELIGSQKRKRTRPPEKYDGKQFRTALLQGNETEEEIAAMKDAANEIDANFIEEQTNFCENYLKGFLKKCKDKRAAEMKQRARESADRLYEAVEFEDLPLDVPQIASEQIIKRSEKLKKEHQKISDLAEKCVNDMVENMFEDKGAGGFVDQTLVIGDSIIKEKPPKPEIFPDFNYLTYHASYRILSYYHLFNPYCFTYPMHQNIPSGFVAHGYHPAEEIFQAVGTFRLGTNDLDPPGQRNNVDDIYVPYLYSFWTNDMEDEISYPDTVSTITITTQPTTTADIVTTTESTTKESEKEHQKLPSEIHSASLPSSSSFSVSSKRRRQKSVSANLENV